MCYFGVVVCKSVDIEQGPRLQIGINPNPNMDK